MIQPNLSTEHKIKDFAGLLKKRKSREGERKEIYKSKAKKYRHAVRLTTTCAWQGMHMGLAMFPPAFPMETCHIPADRVGSKCAVLKAAFIKRCSIKPLTKYILRLAHPYATGCPKQKNRRQGLRSQCQSMLGNQNLRHMTLDCRRTKRALGKCMSSCNH